MHFCIASQVPRCAPLVYLQGCMAFALEPGRPPVDLLGGTPQINMDPEGQGEVRLKAMMFSHRQYLQESFELCECYRPFLEWNLI